MAGFWEIYRSYRELWGGALFHGVSLAACALVIIGGQLGLRSGIKECRRVLPWALLGLVLHVAIALGRSLDRGTPEFRICHAITGMLLFTWVAYAIFRIRPCFFGKRTTKRDRE
jgi:chromate transport protein ChrA